MSTYDWPDQRGWWPNRFEMRVQPNTRVFMSPYSADTQAIDLLGERWAVTLSLPPGTSHALGAAREAFFDRLSGPVHKVRLWNFKRPVPLGTLRDGAAASVVNASAAAVTVRNASSAVVTVRYGQPINTAAIAQLANTATLCAKPGVTLEPGDHIGLPNGQNVRIMARATANGSGSMSIEFLPRARSAMAAYAGPIVWDKPTLTMVLKSDGVPTPWAPGGVFDGASLDLIESP